MHKVCKLLIHINFFFKAIFAWLITSQKMHMVDSKQACGKDELVSNIEEIFVMRPGYT